MNQAPTKRLCLALFALISVFGAASTAASATYNIRDYGAIGDGKTIDSAAINAAIQAASDAGGGTVWFPAGTYASYSVRMKSNITLFLDHGATLFAADPPAEGEGTGGYDPAEPNVWGDEHRYQDFGHSHWQNSLIWGIGLENIGIIGPGTIDGRGLAGGRRFLLPHEQAAEAAAAAQSNGETPVAGGQGGGGGGQRRGGRGFNRDSREGNGDKAIAFKLCRNVTLRDFSVFRGGHFALLVTGVDNLTIDNLRVDTNRDGFDIDACRNVRVSNCHVNAPNDDAIVLKSSYGLGEARATENVTITNCQVSGYAIGSMLDGTFDRSVVAAPDQDGPTGRIKFGTESNGGFKNITISNCVFDRSRGLALEIVDGGFLEDVTITNLTMRDIVNAPIFLRLGNRARGPEGTEVGEIRRVNISNIVVYDADSRYASQIVGLPGHNIQDVSLSNIHILYKGGLTMEQVAAQPEDLVNSFFLRRGDPEASGPREPFNVPEQAAGYPEPSMFGLLPAYGLYVRHAEGIKVHNVEFGLMETDTRPAVVLDDVADAEFLHFEAQTAPGSPTFVLRNVREFSTHRVKGLADLERDVVESESF